MTDKLPNDPWGNEYRRWLADVKQRVARARVRAVASVNRELVTLYWRIGREILDRSSAKGGVLG